MSETTTTTESVAETSGDSSTEAANTATESATTTTATEGENALGDAGKKALDAMKADRNAAREQAKSLEARLAELQAKVDGTEAEHKAAAEAQRVKDEALAAANDRILKAEVRALAAGKLADPQDALRFLNMSEFEVGSDGEVDGKSIEAAIADLVQSKPYLAAQGDKRFQGGADGGARNDATKPSQLTKADLGRMSPEEISAAYDSGQLSTLMNPNT